MAGSEEEAAVMRHAINWFELPATELERAKAFYTAILGTGLSEIAEADDRRFAMFPAEDGVTGAIVQGEGHVPSREGVLIFLNAGDELEPAVNRVEAAGGSVLTPPMDMGEWGVATFIVDSEGNKVALHAAA
jgi:predicted enzyme related to lactoylglutathione lyase